MCCLIEPLACMYTVTSCVNLPLPLIFAPSVIHACIFPPFIITLSYLSVITLCPCHLIALPLQPASSSMPQSRVTASVPENLSLFLDPVPKAEVGAVKKLSKDSILSLYASTPSVHASSMATHGEIWRTFVYSLKSLLNCLSIAKMDAFYL